MLEILAAGLAVSTVLGLAGPVLAQEAGTPVNPYPDGTCTQRPSETRWRRSVDGVPAATRATCLR